MGLTVGTVNAVALYLELLVPIAVWLSWTRWRSTAFSAGLGALGAFALLVTGSRGAWLGAAAGAVILAALVWRTSGLSLARLGTPRTRLILAAGLAIGVVLLVPTFVSRMLSGDAGRIELWTAAWSMFTSSPIVGVGPGAWPSLRAFTPISDDNLAVLATSHNSILQVLAESGVIGLLAAAWIVVTVARVGWRAVIGGRDGDARILAAVALASLAAALVHSVVDTQFHLPAIVLLVLHLVARLELAAPPDPEPATRRPGRLAVATAAIGILIGALVLVPIDVAMVRAAVGNAALDRGDPGGALPEFDAAVALHPLPAYRLGVAIASRGLGDDAGRGQRARGDGPRRAVHLHDGPARGARGRPGAALGAGRCGRSVRPDRGREPRRPALPDGPGARAARDLAAAMVQVPPLVYSDRPPTLFDDAHVVGGTGDGDRGDRLDGPGHGGCGRAARRARRGRHRAPAGTARGSGTPGARPPRCHGVGSAARRRRRSRAAAGGAGSTGLQNVLWMLGFEAGSQPLLDAVRAVAVPLYFNVPIPPMELVLDGRVDADYSMRLPRWPQASSGRNGPKRPYIDGFITIEPVFRPKP